MRNQVGQHLEVKNKTKLDWLVQKLLKVPEVRPVATPSQKIVS